MDDEEKVAWLYREMVLTPIQKEIDRDFQRFGFFLLASSFLVTAFVAAVTSPATSLCSEEELARVGSVLAICGLSLSTFFFAVGCWNSACLQRFQVRAESTILPPLPNHPRQVNFKASIQHLRQLRKNAYSQPTYKTLRESLTLGNLGAPVWHGRATAFGFIVVWTILGSIPKDLPVWVVPPVALVVGAALVAYIMTVSVLDGLTEPSCPSQQRPRRKQARLPRQ